MRVAKWAFRWYMAGLHWSSLGGFGGGSLGLAFRPMCVKVGSSCFDAGRYYLFVRSNSAVGDICFYAVVAAALQMYIQKWPRLRCEGHRTQLPVVHCSGQS